MRSRRPMLRAAWLPLVLATFGAGATAAATAADSGDSELRACAKRALALRNLRQRQHVRVVSAAGWTRESVRTLVSQRDADGTFKVLLRLERPLAEAGLKVLALVRAGADPVLYVYTPDSGRARRVVGSGASNSVLGTDFTFEDALYLEQVLHAGRSRRLPDTHRDGQQMLTVETVPEADASAYGRIVSEFDRASCVPLVTRFHTPNGTLAKTLSIERARIREVAGHALPFALVMHDHLRGSRTEVSMSDVEIPATLPARLFTITELEQSQ